jgi:hypothetical protein
MQLLYGSQDAEPETWVPVARVGPPKGRVFAVEWLIDREAAAYKDMVAAAVRDLDFYLTEVGGADPWSYAQYHAGTASNWYGFIHWDNYVRSAARGAKRGRDGE